MIPHPMPRHPMARHPMPPHPTIPHPMPPHSPCVPPSTPPSPALARIRAQVQRESERDSWTRHDIDVLVPPGAALHISGDARWKWMHGTRLGVAPAGASGGEARARVSEEANRLAGYASASDMKRAEASGTGLGAGVKAEAAGAGAGSTVAARSKGGWFGRSSAALAPVQPAHAPSKAAPAPAAQPTGGLLHWFGRPDELFGPTPERHSVVFAFAAPDD